jgi:hypothetical protein
MPSRLDLASRLQCLAALTVDTRSSPPLPSLRSHLHSLRPSLGWPVAQHRRCRKAQGNRQLLLNQIRS